jgi:hypothetical protein
MSSILDYNSHSDRQLVYHPNIQRRMDIASLIFDFPLLVTFGLLN